MVAWRLRCHCLTSERPRLQDEYVPRSAGTCGQTGEPAATTFCETFQVRLDEHGCDARRGRCCGGGQSRSMPAMLVARALWTTFGTPRSHCGVHVCWKWSTKRNWHDGCFHPSACRLHRVVRCWALVWWFLDASLTLLLLPGTGQVTICRLLQSLIGLVVCNVLVAVVTDSSATHRAGCHLINRTATM